jgi:hypothetical protein
VKIQPNLPTFEFASDVPRFETYNSAHAVAVKRPGTTYIYHVIDAIDGRPVYVLTHEPLAAPLKDYIVRGGAPAPLIPTPAAPALRVTLTVGTTSQWPNAAPLSHAATIAELRWACIARWGGVSIAPVTGSWRDEAGQLVEETSFVATVIVTGDAADDPTYVELQASRAARQLGALLQQDSVLFTVEPIRGAFVSIPRR